MFVPWNVCVCLCVMEERGYQNPLHGGIQRTCSSEKKKIKWIPLPHPHLVSSFPQWAKEPPGSQYPTAGFSLPWLRRIFQGTCPAPGPENDWPSLLTLRHSPVSEMFVWKQSFPWLWLPPALRTRCATKPRTFCVVLSCVPSPEISACHDVFGRECLWSKAHTSWSALDSADPDPQCRYSEVEWRFFF